MTFGRLMEFLDVKDPLRSEIVEAYFGADVFLGKQAKLQPGDVGALYLLRSAHGLVWFDDHDCWMNFLQRIGPILFAQRDSEITEHSTWLGPLLVYDGKSLAIVNSDDSLLRVWLPDNRELSADQPDKSPTFVHMLYCTPLMLRGIREFATFCDRAETTDQVAT